MGVLNPICDLAGQQLLTRDRKRKIPGNGLQNMFNLRPQLLEDFLGHFATDLK